MRLPNSRRRVATAIAIAVTAIVVGGCGGASSQSGGSSKGTLTVWMQGSLADQNIQWLPTVARRFEQAHPGVKIDLVPKPTANFVALVRTAVISGSGPDLIGLYSGTEVDQFIPQLVNLNKYISPSILRKVTDIQYFAKNTNISDGTYAVPTENQFYIMFYNKALFKKAGIKSPPRDFSEALADSKMLKARHILPFVYGTALGLPEMSAVWDWSYLAAGPYSLNQWNGLLSGQIPYTSKPLVTALSNWHSIYANGFTNSNALNAPNALQQFEAGKAAMLMSYSGYIPAIQKSLGANLGVMPPPWQVSPKPVIAGMPGFGFGALKQSAHAKLAAEFAQSIISLPSQKLAAAQGQIPVLTSAATTRNKLQLQLARWDTSPTFHQYPMYDNLSQPSVTDILNKELPAVFVGQTSPQSAASALQSALNALPPDQRKVNYNLGGS